jgi:uridylate kinase
MMKHSNRKLFFASGWRPGWSTDYIAVRLAQKFGAKEVLIAKDTPFVYDADPKKSNDAKAFKRISWRAYKKLIPPTWKPGLSAPVDPIATRLAAKSRMSAKIFKAADFKSFQNALEGQSFEGTIIS